MRLRWKTFERSVWKRVGKYDARTFWQRLEHRWNIPLEEALSYWLVRGSASSILGLIIVLNRDTLFSSPDLWLAGIGLWGLFLAFSRASIIRNVAQTCPEYRLFMMMPLPMDAVVHQFFRKILLGTSWAAIDFFIPYCLLATNSKQLLFACTCALVSAFLQGLFSTCLTFMIIAARLNSALFSLTLFFCFLLLAPIFSSPYAVPIAKFLNLFNPAGWISVAFFHGIILGNSNVWWAFLAVLLVFSAFPVSFRIMKGLYQNQSFQLVKKGIFASSLFLPDEDTDTAEGNHETVPRISDLDFARPIAWSQLGVIEWLIQQLLNTREKHIAEMLSAHLSRLSNLCWGCATFTAIHLIFCMLLQPQHLRLARRFLSGFGDNLSWIQPLLFMLLIYTPAFAIMYGLMRFFSWPGWPEHSQRNASHAGLRLVPVNYWDIVKVIAKVNSLLILLILPLAVIISLSIGPGFTSGKLKIFPSLPLKALVALWCCMLFVLSFKLITPEYQFTLRHFISFGKVITVIAGFLVLGIGLLFSPNLWLDCVLGVALALSSFGWFVYCGKRYCAGRLI